MGKLFTGISCNLDSNILATTLPLFEEGIVEAIEWSFDALFRHENIPDWFKELLQLFGNEGRLIGHGVYYSLFSGKWKPEQAEWLKHLGQTSKDYRFDHVSEHFGYMTGADFHKGAPLSVPYNRETLKVAKDRIVRMHSACKCPVGLENLAFSYAYEEIERHGNFLNEIIEAVNGFIILDLHNVYCQVHNFKIPFSEIIQLYPLDKVREIHISGGSWKDSKVEPGRKIRRDTHDNAVPAEVFEYLAWVIDQVPNLKFVILEQMGADLQTAESKIQFQQDFKSMQAVCKQRKNHLTKNINKFLPLNKIIEQPVYESHLLNEQQKVLSTILEESNDFNTAKKHLSNSILAYSDWKIEHWMMLC